MSAIWMMDLKTFYIDKWPLVQPMPSFHRLIHVRSVLPWWLSCDVVELTADCDVIHDVANWCSMCEKSWVEFLLRLTLYICYFPNHIVKVDTM